jgi:hypothetical protein
MADKKDMARFLDLFENLVLRYEAFQRMAKDSDPQWAVPLNKYRQANTARIRQEFDAIRTGLSGGAPRRGN